MTIQTMTLSRPILNVRSNSATNAANAAHRGLRRAEQAGLDGVQAVVRGGHGLTVLLGVDHPAPNLTFDLPALTAEAPLVVKPYGVLAQLLTTMANWPEARAAVRASAHTLSLSLATTPQSLQAADLVQLIERLAGDEPLVIHIEHLHRADAPSLKLLQAIGAELTHRPILLIGTYRADQSHPAELVAWLGKAQVMTAVSAPVWADDNAVWLDAVFGRKTPLGTMLEAAKANDQQLLLGGIPLLEACRRTGRWTDGLTLSERIINLAQLLGAEYVLAVARVIRSQILLGLGQWTEAQAECDQVITSRACARDGNLTAAAVWGGYKSRSMLDLPARNLMEALKRWRATVRFTDDVASVAAILADLTVHLVETGQLSDARSWLREVETLVERTGHPQARLAESIAQGALANHTSDWRAAAGAYRAAVQHSAGLRDLLFEARANSGLAVALLQIGDAESKNEGRERLSVAHSVLSRLSARPDMERCEAGAKQFGLRPRQRRPNSANRTPGALTRREREVLALVVNGLTNRQIAQRLTISEKTAEGHVGNILAKLSVSSRGKAAELAKATGLLEGGAV